MSFRTRLILGLNALLLAAVALVSGIMLYAAVQGLRETARRGALSSASVLAGALTAPQLSPQAAPAPALDRAALQRVIQAAVDAGYLDTVFVIAPEGEPIVFGTRSDRRELAKEYYGEDLEVFALGTARTLKPAARFHNGSVEACVPLLLFGGRAGALLCQTDAHAVDQAIASSLRDIAALALAAMIAGVFVATALARRVSRPVRRLVEAARVVGAGQFSHRVRVDSDDEVGTLADSFNKMIDSIETYTAQLAQTTAEKEALGRELDIAATIQRSLLPESCPQVEHFDLAAENLPAREVGGDFYDFIPLPGGRWGVLVADVSGKSVPAALFMALSRTLIRAYSHDQPSAVAALRLVNDVMLRDMRSEMFVTCFYAVIDPQSRTLTYVNSGHNPPLVIGADGQISLLHASGMPLGVAEEPGIREQSCELAPGDILLLYTDGITEATDPSGEQFNLRRLQDLARNSRAFPASEISSRLLTAVRTFSAGHQFDDITTVVVKAV